MSQRVRAGARTTLSRLPGRHGLGLIPWVVPLLFGLAGGPVSTEGPDEGAWIRALVTANVAAWITQGAVLLLVRRRALRWSPTPRNGLRMVALFALIGAIGGAVQALVLARVDLPDPPQFTSPLTLVLFSTLTWVSTASIIAFAFSWRDQLADSLRGSEVRAQETRDALTRSTELEAYRRRVVGRLLRERTLPALVRLADEVRGRAAVASPTCADALERLARHDVRTAAHLLHPVTRADDLATALAAACRPLGVAPTVADPPLPLPPETIDRAALATAELLLEQDAAVSRPPLIVTYETTAAGATLVLRHGRTVRIPIGAPVPTPPAQRPPRWYRIAPAPHGMPWVAIALLNAFSVLVATLAAGSGLWAAAFVDIAVITVGTAALDRLLRLPVVRRASARGQWLLIGGYVAALGALAGGIWGALIGGEAQSLAILGLVCALGMGLFLPGIRVWSAAIRDLRAEAVLDGLAVAAVAVRERVRALAATTAAAESLHASVQSQLLAVAGALAADIPADLRREALGMLDDVADRSLPAIVAQLEAPPGDDEAVPLDASVLASIWPQVAISMRVPDAMPASALRLFNSVVVEAVGNAVQHGRADAVDVQAELWPGALTITVDDDGSGVAPQTRDGLGLAAIRAIASECSLRPRPTGGTRFEVRLPYLA